SYLCNLTRDVQSRILRDGHSTTELLSHLNTVLLLLRLGISYLCNLTRDVQSRILRDGHSTTELLSQ
ncbi:MAG TPA: hypothetical protein PLN79_15445, partial [bacterium]|nr:hypothetical protein [bacterium]